MNTGGEEEEQVMRERERGEREGESLHYLDPNIFLSSSSLFSLGVLSSVVSIFTVLSVSPPPQSL